MCIIFTITIYCFAIDIYFNVVCFKCEFGLTCVLINLPEIKISIYCVCSVFNVV